ncbi:MAG: hypothetical protein WA902_12225 [Thermosynechococcaceae cyanobacterium]
MLHCPPTPPILGGELPQLGLFLLGLEATESILTLLNAGYRDYATP